MPRLTLRHASHTQFDPWSFELTEALLSESEAFWRNLITILTMIYCCILIVLSMLSALFLLIAEAKSSVVLIVCFVAVRLLLTWLIVRANRLRERDIKPIRLGYQEQGDLHVDAVSSARLAVILGLLFANTMFVGGVMRMNLFAMVHGVIRLLLMAWGFERLIERNVR